MNSRSFPGRQGIMRHTTRSITRSVRSSLAIKLFLKHHALRRLSCRRLAHLQAVPGQFSFAQWMDREAASASISAEEWEQRLRRQALTAARQQHYVKAIQLFTQLIAYNPSNATDYNNRGLVYFQQGYLHKALVDYNIALQLNPRLASVYNNRANCYAAQGQLAEAIADYDTAIDLNPTHLRARINQGITFRELEMFDRALENFDAALGWGKLEDHIYAERGRTYHLRGDWNCAIADYQRALDCLINFAQTSTTQHLWTQVNTWMAELFMPSA